MFKLLRIENGRMNVPSPAFYDIAAATTVSIGDALVLSSGKLVKPTTATAKPEFIAMGEKGVTAEDTKLAVCRCAPNQLWGVPCSGTFKSVVPGAKVALGTDNASVDLNATGAITVENLNGATAAGDEIIVRIV